MTHGTSERRVLKIRRRRDNLFSFSLGKKQRTSTLQGFQEQGFRERATAIKVKVKVNHPKVGDTSRLLAS